MNIDWTHFTPISALLGGSLIGLSATLLLLLHGRIAGITGIVSGAIDVQTRPQERLWRVLFVMGLVLGPLLLLKWMPAQLAVDIERSPFVLIFAGTLVGIGTRVGSGCTSGHGVCGISRGSTRSLVATLTFIATGMVTVMLYRLLSGGGA